MDDAENAAWKLAFVLRGWAGESLLDSYPSERRQPPLENLEVTSATMGFLVPQSPEGERRRRDVLEAAVTDPGVPAASTPGGWPSRSGTSTRR